MDFKISLNQLVGRCKTLSKSLNKVQRSKKTIVQWFQDYCGGISQVLVFTSRNLEELEKQQKDLLLLYCTQLLTNLSLLINVFVGEADLDLTLSEARYFANQQVITCLNGIESTILLEGSSTAQEPGSFIKFMDSALESIADINIEQSGFEVQFEEAESLFQEVLCHAMSIAQVALPEDCKVIKGASQAVLESLECLTKELKKATRNKSMINLFIDYSTDKLCSLESKVNNAVLRLTLQVFAHFTDSLEEIDQFCCEKSNRNNLSELDGLVADFDLHVDQIMQIGLFAVSCSTCSNRCIKIRSCLASLEALETELVPAFTAMLLDCSSHNVAYAKMLKLHWLHQAKLLQNMIYLIIDPLAFDLIILEKCKEIVDKLSEDTKNNTLTLESVKNLVLKAKILEDFLTASQKEISPSIKDKVNLATSDFTKVLFEVQASAEKLLKTDHKSEDKNRRVLKRCKILLTTITRVKVCFEEETSIPITPPQKAQKENLVPNNKFLENFIERGQQILKERSILYKSPMKTPAQNKITKKTPKKEIPLSKLVHMRKLSFKSPLQDGELQIVDILTELTNMSNLSLN